MELIAEQGVQALAVEPLARRMGITKGSFYWHFSSRESLLEKALSRWEEHDSRNLTASLGEFNHPRDRLVSFFRRVPREKLTHEVYSELCAAAGHPHVEPVLERVAERRMQHLSAAFRELGLDGLPVNPRSGTIPEMAMSAVLLPAPLAPMRVTISPTPTSKETPRTASMRS